MEPYHLSANMSSTMVHPPFAFHSSNHYPLEQRPLSLPLDTPQDDKADPGAAFMKGPKRKRLAKACDACHKSKRRCDGTAPCSNCYFASKSCTYTDASGRPVPAPRPFKADRADPPPLAPPPPAADSHSVNASNSNNNINNNNNRQLGPYGTQFPSAGESRFSQPAPQPHPHHVTNGYPPAPGVTASSQVMSDLGEDEQQNSRKRFRTERGNPIPSEDIPIEPGPAAIQRPVPVELDHALTRELTNLFFTHCHPSHSIIHKPSFSSDLSHNEVPTYLLYAVCALAAPLSKQPRIRTTPARFAGRRFAQEALSLMFDGAGRLMVAQNLATAQALCLLQIHDVHAKDHTTSWSSRYHDYALQIVESLGVHNPEHPTLTPVPSLEFIQNSIARECIRRIFWLSYLLDVMASVYFKKPISFNARELRLRLPADETSFELAVHSTLPEYLHLPAVRTQYASEFGHLIRVVAIYANVEHALDALKDLESNPNPNGALLEAEKALDSWASSLPEHLRFSAENLQVQLSMFETSSNMGAWCYCCTHVYHASTALALNAARHRLQWSQNSEVQWALERLDMILKTLGSRARNSVLMGAALWSLIKYCRRDDPQVRAWSVDYEEFSAIKMYELASKEWRLVPSPPLQHQPYPPPHQQQQQQHSQAPQRRRPSEARHPGTSPVPVPRPPPHQPGGDVSYNNRGRSPSSSPSAYPLGRSLGELRLHNRTSDRDARVNAAGAGPGPNTVSGPNPGSAPGAPLNEREKDARRIISDSDIDPALQNGGSSQRANSGHVASAGDGPQSLPSLKASGLLDSWNSSTRVEVQKHGSNGTLPRRSPPAPSPSHPHSVHDPDARTATLGMPVGLQWLANESR